MVNGVWGFGRSTNIVDHVPQQLRHARKKGDGRSTKKCGHFE